MKKLDTISPYSDELGNEIVYEGSLTTGVSVQFTGSNNRLVIAPGVRIKRLAALFDCNNALIQIGTHTTRLAPLQLFLRVGEDSKIILGDDLSTTNLCVISAVEGTTVDIGDDAMIATDTEIRSDDSHPIFDIRTGARINPSRSITIGKHVWIARRAVIMGGSIIGDGAVIGHGAFVKGKIPNNCVAVGSPARVVRRDIAWERPHLSINAPFYKPDADSITRSDFWHPTDEQIDGVPAPVVLSFHVDGVDYGVDFADAQTARDWWDPSDPSRATILTKTSTKNAERLLGRDPGTVA
ncbi:acyltransferase [Arthrobacter sp. CP30]